MKNLLYYLVMALITVIIFTRCKDASSGYSGNHLHNTDTTYKWCVGVYKLDSANVTVGEIKRATYEALLPSLADAMKNEWRKDTFYVITKSTMVTPAISDQYFLERKVRITLLDSLGKPNYVPYPWLYVKRLVRSGWSELDSAISQLKREKL